MNSSVKAHLVLAWGMVALACAAAQPPGRPARPSFEELLRTIRTGNAYQRAQAMPPLSWIEDPRVVPELVALLQDEDATVRTYSSQQLARLADERSADALAEALRDPTGNVRRHAAEGLAKIGKERHVPALVAAVMNHLPDAKTPGYQIYPTLAPLAALAKLSPKAPAELLALMATVSDNQTIKGEAWWRLLAEVARCLGQIGDKAAGGALLQARTTLETDHQDYRTWYAVRQALAAIDPQNMPFDRPAADILDAERPSKGEDITQAWVLPLAKLGREAVDDLSWVLQFNSEWDRRRVNIAMEALGEIGGDHAAVVLRQYIEKQARVPEKGRPAKSSPLREALLALLKADPNETAVKEVIVSCQQLDSFVQEYLVHDVARVSSERISPEIKMVFYKSALLGSAEIKPLDRYGARAAAQFLGQMGGPQAGEILSTALTTLTLPEPKEAAIRALGTIKDYDALPTLAKASKLARTPKGAIARAMGTIGDARAVPALQEMVDRYPLRDWDRLWVAAALARLGADYEDNARLIRDALPEAMEPATWLHDDESIRVIATFLHAGEPMAQRAMSTLEAIGTDNALNALTGRIDVETISDTMSLQQLSGVAARMAEKLGRPSAKYWTSVTTTSGAIRGWFIVTQIRQPSPEQRPSFAGVIQNLALARKVWIAEANHRLDLAAIGEVQPYQYSIPRAALLGAEAIYDPQFVPTLERMTREGDFAGDFRGKDRVVKHYATRSLAAKILTDKTGRVHTFVDANGRTHPGGWDPSQDSE
jgi:HEAT repeat protein